MDRNIEHDLNTLYKQESERLKAYQIQKLQQLKDHGTTSTINLLK